MKFERYIAKRYLISKHKLNFITIISFLSIAGITIGVAALIVVLSVFNGFGSLVTSLLVNIDPHIRIENTDDKYSYDESYIKKTVYESYHNIKAFSPFVSGKVLAYKDRGTQVVSLKGVSPESGDILYNLSPNISYGTYDLSDNSGTPSIVLGVRLADRLQTLIGDTVTLISPSGIEESISQMSMPKMQQFIVKGIFSSNNNEYDASLMFCSLKQGQELLGYGNRVQGYEAKIDNINKSYDLKNTLEKALNKDQYSINTWYDFHKELYNVMQMERWAAYIILSLIIAVAVFNILGSLSMSVIEKKRDIGILSAMGASEKSITKIFMFEGILIGIFGTLFGALLGYFVCYLQLKYNIYPLDPTQYKIDSLPLEIRITDFFYVAGASMLLSFLAALYPAKKAAKVNPLEAIKWE
ncbi:MAG: ABC transporter permease [Bacteroidota bacterium]|nr:ABC transporter permease [Bacteroidota bacterium]